jgi:hypothetical protein
MMVVIFLMVLAQGLVMGQSMTAVPVRSPIVQAASLSLEVQITADHWQQDIHIPEKWGKELLLEEERALRFRFTRISSNPPSTVYYHIYKGKAPTMFASARPIASRLIGAPPHQGQSRQFDIDFKEFLPAKPDGFDYHVVLSGLAAGGASSICSNVLKVSYKRQSVTKFPTPILRRVVGTRNALGQELLHQQTPVAMITQLFSVEGSDLDASPQETVVQFLRQNKVHHEVRPEHKLTRALPAGGASLSLRVPRSLSHGMYSVRVKSPWGITNQLPVYIGGNRWADVAHWQLVEGGVYENHAWTEECQGIATDGKYWYISSNNKERRALYKFTMGMELVKSTDVAKHGVVSAHIGGLDYFDGKLYVALEQPKQLLVIDTEFKNASLHQFSGNDPLGGTFAWCTIHPITGDLCTTKFDGASALFSYRKAADGSYVFAGSVPLAKTVTRVQGGDITPTGKLVLVSDTKPRGGIHVFNVFTGEYHGAVTFPVENGSPLPDELEGLAISPPGTAVVKGVPVNVHLILLDNDYPSKDDVRFKHFSPRNLGDLFDY